MEEEMNELCDEVIWLRDKYKRNILSRFFYKAASILYCFITGLKTSNYYIGKLWFTENAISKALKKKVIDIVIYEYFHAWESANYFKKQNIPVILDTHNILWQSYLAQYKHNNILPNFLKGYYFRKYKETEERIWSFFDEVIAINTCEQVYIKSKVSASTNVPLIYMGIDVSAWQYSWLPASPVRLAFYGGLGSPHNARSAIACAKEIMPEIWKEFPETELWLIGSNPTEEVKSLESDKIHITGFIKDVAPLISTVSIMLCPWEGKYGFRSRIIEVMSLGVTVVASRDAVYGMDMEHGIGIYLNDSSSEMIDQCIRLLRDRPALTKQSKLASDEVKSRYSFESTYLAGFQELYKKVESKKEINQ